MARRASNSVPRRVAATVVLLLGAALAASACEGTSGADSDTARVALPPGMLRAPSTNADARPPAVPFDSATTRAVGRVVTSWSHDTAAFTQGLAIHAGRLYESTGLEGRSQVRELDRRTGAVRRSTALPDSEFGEGIAALGDRLYQVTWRHGRGYVYDLRSFARVDSFSYVGEGWGLATDGQWLYMSDGTSWLRVLAPADFREVRRIHVREGGRPVWALNELEWVRGELWANVYQTSYVARIDPSSGEVRGWLDLSGVSARFTPAERSSLERAGGVPNGIAFDSATGQLLVTGKRWPRLFQVALPPAGGERAP